MCWCVDVLLWLMWLMCWCVDVLMCWCVDVLNDVLMCWCVDVIVDVLMCWCIDVLMCYETRSLPNTMKRELCLILWNEKDCEPFEVQYKFCDYFVTHSAIHCTGNREQVNHITSQSLSMWCDCDMIVHDHWHLFTTFSNCEKNWVNLEQEIHHVPPCTTMPRFLLKSFTPSFSKISKFFRSSVVSVIESVAPWGVAPKMKSAHWYHRVDSFAKGTIMVNGFDKNIMLIFKRTKKRCQHECKTCLSDFMRTKMAKSERACWHQSTHQHINTSTHQHINTSTHQINTSTHQHINTSTHQQSHQHININTSISTHQVWQTVCVCGGGGWTFFFRAAVNPRCGALLWSSLRGWLVIEDPAERHSCTPPQRLAPFLARGLDKTPAHRHSRTWTVRSPRNPRAARGPFGADQSRQGSPPWRTSPKGDCASQST